MIAARLWFRTVCGVAVLAAFPSMLVVLLGSLIAAEMLLLAYSVGKALLWALVIVPATLAVARGLRVLLTRVIEPVQGVLLTEPGHPELWELVRRLAAAAGTRPPDEIYLNDEICVSVVEDTRLLGLVSVRRRMFLGAPLVVGMREDQFAAVLTHELAHYGNWDTRLSVLAYRGRRAFVSTMSSLNRSEMFDCLLARLLDGWMRLYLRVSGGLSQRQERAADAAAASAAGTAAMAGALREIAVATEAWRLFAEHHLRMGWDAGYLPADIFGGYAQLRTSMSEQLDTIRRNPPNEARTHDSHPPIASRLAALDHTAGTPTMTLGQRPAAALLNDAATPLDAAVVLGLGPEARTKRRADWDTLAHAHGAPPATAAAAAIMTAAARLTERPATLRTVLTALDAGHLADLAGVRPTRGIGPRGRREQARPAVRAGLLAAVELATAEAGAASWQPAWPSCARLAVDAPYEAELPRLIEAAVADRPDTTGLRALLHTANVDVDRTDLIT
jgi:Zn-dependent protease with chaperone function